MKLLYCPMCYDVKKLGFTRTTCSCGFVVAHYDVDDPEHLRARWNGQGCLLGINNSSLANALTAQAQAQWGDHPDKTGRRIEAFIIPTCAPSVKIGEEL